MEIKLTYATFEQAKKLKEKGFNVECRNYYLEKDKALYEGFEDEYWGDYRCRNWNADVIGIKPFQGFVSAPEQWQVIEWLRVEKGIWIQIFPIGEDKEMKYYCKIIKNDNGWVKIVHQISTIVITPQEAYSAAFDYILKELI
jgi:hypothetical protein